MRRRRVTFRGTNIFIALKIYGNVLKIRILKISKENLQEGKDIQRGSAKIWKVKSNDLSLIYRY